jgi:hypothetical protein
LAGGGSGSGIIIIIIIIALHGLPVMTFSIYRGLEKARDNCGREDRPTLKTAGRADHRPHKDRRS